jgi:hypothetical protein
MPASSLFMRRNSALIDSKHFFEMAVRKGIKINHFVVILNLIWTGLAAPLMYEQKKTKSANSLGGVRLI